MTENWSNDAENAALPIQMQITFIKIVNIYFKESQCYSFYCIFYQINAALVHNKEVFQNM